MLEKGQPNLTSSSGENSPTLTKRSRLIRERERERERELNRPGKIVALRERHHLAVPDHQRGGAVLVAARQAGADMKLKDRQPDAKLRLWWSRHRSPPHGPRSLFRKLGQRARRCWAGKSWPSAP